jgi:ABC-type polysaccharide/polyol phosphate export permease
MFQPNLPRNSIGSFFNILELIYHATVRSLRMSHGNAVIGLLKNLTQSVIFVGVFYIMFIWLNMRSAAVRGDFLLYVMSGVFLFMTHTKALGAVVGAEGPSSPMMQHGPMNTIVAIASSALASLYIQVLSMIVMLSIYYALVTPFVVDNPVGAVAMVLLSWFSGVAVGMIFLAIKPWAPGFVGIASSLYQRANMIASGKMFLANSLPPSRLVMFSWNPLFHTIDQGRGDIFINYSPHNTSVWYPVAVSLVLIMIGLMGEFFTRRHVSLSWGAKR